MPKTDPNRTDARSGTGSNKVIAYLTRRWLAIVLLIVAAFFIVQNRDATSITLFFAHIVMPQWMALTVMFIVGLVAGILIARNRRGAGR